MRLTSSVSAWTLLVSTVHLASASDGYVYSLISGTGNKNSFHSHQLESLSPSIARIVLAQRLGVEDFHTAHGLSNEEIDAINVHGAKTSLLETVDDSRRAIILAPYTAATLDAGSPLSDPEHRLQPIFTVENAPSFRTTEELFQDLKQQTDALSSSAARGLTPMVNTVDNVHSAMSTAGELEKDGFEVTMLLIEQAERSETSWGSYEMPKRGSLFRRQSAHRLQDEEPLSAAIASIQSATGFHLLASNSSNSTNSTNSKPLHGILPACFNSKSACESTTRGCTGHGACTLKYTNADSKTHKECWGCACNATKSNGLTTYWAGPACQKKDISVEFWLITLFTVGLISLVGFAVGTIWSMGEEDLPSVIGAGVSGPTARK